MPRGAGAAGHGAARGSAGADADRKGCPVLVGATLSMEARASELERADADRNAALTIEIRNVRLLQVQGWAWKSVLISLPFGA
jgi:hypothetical protein